MSILSQILKPVFPSENAVSLVCFVIFAGVSLAWTVTGHHVIHTGIVIERVYLGQR